MDQALHVGASLELPEPAFRHMIQVLRMQVGDGLTVFNGLGGEFEATIETVGKRSARIVIGPFMQVDRESALQLTLVQGIAKGDRMDWAVQKSVELGVTRIFPVLTERCNVNISQGRGDKRLEHWRGVMLSACEQSGRTSVPVMEDICSLSEWFSRARDGLALILDPLGDQRITDVQMANACASVVIGPEGGLTMNEISAGQESGCTAVRMGPRILRTETAGPAAMAALHILHGDFRY